MLNFRHLTLEKFLARFRQDYRDAAGERLAFLADRLLALRTSNDVTDAQIRNAFGITVAQWAALRSRMESLVNARRTLRSAIGE